MWVLARNAIPETATAPTITNARLGSQCPQKSKKARTLLGRVIPERQSPAENKKPDPSATKPRFMRRAS
jgi:hypothetical protein